MSRRDREEARQAEGRKWARAMAVRQSWAASDHVEESARLEAEIAALLAAGKAQTLPPGYAKGATGNAFAD